MNLSGVPCKQHNDTRTGSARRAHRPRLLIYLLSKYVFSLFWALVRVILCCAAVADHAPQFQPIGIGLAYKCSSAVVCQLNYPLLQIYLFALISPSADLFYYNNRCSVGARHPRDRQACFCV